ncbi:MAG TPA: MBL fold metallo-hydrolase, partial [Phenylobacterium sp.]|nr:MBL fold metallo-hydrolase [Phenylobacterium sp.]
MRRGWIVALGVGIALVLGGLALAYVQRGAIVLALMDRAMARNMAAVAFADLPDGLHVVLCGAGSPMPDPTRAGPCTAVIAGQRLFIVDVGAGATRNLTLMGLPPARAEALLLTHFHSDHMDGLGELMLQ